MFFFFRYWLTRVIMVRVIQLVVAAVIINVVNVLYLG